MACLAVADTESDISTLAVCRKAGGVNGPVLGGYTRAGWVRSAASELSNTNIRTHGTKILERVQSIGTTLACYKERGVNS
jgi:hypothetical protein